MALMRRSRESLHEDQAPSTESEGVRRPGLPQGRFSPDSARGEAVHRSLESVFGTKTDDKQGQGNAALASSHFAAPGPHMHHVTNAQEFVIPDTWGAK